MFFELRARCHEFMAAACTAQSEIRPCPEAEKALRPAGVLFFHFQNIADPNIHFYLH